MNKTILFTILYITAVTAFAQQPKLVNPADFETTIDGQKTGLYTLRGGDLIMQVTNYGGRVVTLFVPDKDGNMTDIVLGHNTLDEYINYKAERFLGAVVGPVANRITDAQYTYKGKTYHLPANYKDKVTLHGGYKGLDSQVWDVVKLSDNSVTLHYLHADGQEGFPGNLHIYMTYTLTDDNCWDITYRAKADKTRPVNIANHPYFNLSGEGNGTVEDYIMYINADSMIGLAADGITVYEEPVSVKGTALDYTTPHSIRDGHESGHIQMQNAGGFDHNYCVNKSRKGLTLAASAYNPANGMFLEVLSDQPGLQVYSGHYWTGVEYGKYGETLDYRSSLTFETQNYPDALNKPSFPDPFLKPGKTYKHHCIYRFSVK